ncbi:MAG: DNA alkylation repair protein [Bacteroidetes bacterium]|nr:DNA alkylation repair protein [Bacteroidota bacterium]
MNNIIEVVRNELRFRSDAKNRESGRRFFKETIQLYGVRSAEVKRISKENFKAVRHLSKKEIFDLCEIFWQSGMIEENFIACDWSYFLNKQYETADFAVFERWVDKYISNWATCDTLCNHNMGTLIMMHPGFLKELKRFAESENRWKKRAAAVSLIVPARKGYFLPEILDIANILLTDIDDMVQKGYGWMLKESSKAHRQEVFDYVISKKAIMPRTALRYAIEKMPEEMRKKAMEK